jgi:hypothetical protein
VTPDQIRGPDVLTHVALVPYRVSIDAVTLTRVAAALQRQVTEHFAPLWDIDATINPFVDWNSVPADYARLVLVEHLDSGALGVHADNEGLPYALVSTRGEWPLVASHECLEMLADPTGRRTQTGPSPTGSGTTVDYLVEVCDPCQGARWSYAIDGIRVSDFCTPAFYDGAPGERWSFRGNIPGPRQILKDGYVIWHDTAAGAWWRRDWLGSQPTDYALGPVPPSVSFLRGHVDRLTRALVATPRRRTRVTAAVSAEARGKANALAAHLDAILAPAPRHKGRS